MPEAADTAAMRAVIDAVRDRIFTGTDEQLLADVDGVEALGRLIDGLRVELAAEVEHRSRPILGTDSLAFKQGAKDGVQLVEQRTRTSHREAARRVGLGAAVEHRRGLLDETLPGRLPALTDAIDTGTIGLEAARVIVELWKDTRLRATPILMATAVESLVDTASQFDVTLVKELAAEWRLALDPAGSKPPESQRRRNRALRIGDTLADGTTRVTAIMLPEHLAVLKELLQAARRGTPLTRTEAGSDDPEEPLEPEWREDGTHPDVDDPRSRAQQDYDTVVDALELAAKAQAAGFPGTSTTQQVVFTATVEDVLERDGVGWASGILAGIPLPVIEQTACTGETRLQVNGPDGEPLYLAKTHRLFTPAQKIALIRSAGGRCEYPGCRTPAPYLQAHHVEWFTRDDGPTDVSNGIMLCSYHHHLIHDPGGPVEIRRWDGNLYIVPKTWNDAPLPGHRRRERIDLTRQRIRTAAIPWWAAEKRPDLLNTERSPD